MGLSVMQYNNRMFPGVSEVLKRVNTLMKQFHFIAGEHSIV